MGPGERTPLQAVTGQWTDNVARWDKLRDDKYPEAQFTYSGGWFYGAFREADNVMRADDLGGLIDRLMARESYPDGPGITPRS